MEFYKDARVLGLTSGETLNLDSAVYNHKAALFIGNNSQTVNIQFYNKGSLSTNISLAVPTPTLSNISGSTIAARLARVTPSAAGVTLTLFN